jgi:hypothetical protein
MTELTVNLLPLTSIVKTPPTILGSLFIMNLEEDSMIIDSL